MVEALARRKKGRAAQVIPMMRKSDRVRVIRHHKAATKNRKKTKASICDTHAFNFHSFFFPHSFHLSIHFKYRISSAYFLRKNECYVTQRYHLIILGMNLWMQMSFVSGKNAKMRKCTALEMK